MSEEKGIQQTKEAVVGLIKIAALLGAAFKDGVQATDFVQIVLKIESDTVLKQAIMDAYNGIDQVPGEIQNISFAEGLSMLPEVMEALKELFAAVKK